MCSRWMILCTCSIRGQLWFTENKSSVSESKVIAFLWKWEAIIVIWWTRKCKYTSVRLNEKGPIDRMNGNHNFHSEVFLIIRTYLLRMERSMLNLIFHSFLVPRISLSTSLEIPDKFFLLPFFKQKFVDF